MEKKSENGQSKYVRVCERGEEEWGRESVCVCEREREELWRDKNL